MGTRAALLASLDRIVALAQSEQRSKDAGQTSMFDVLGDASAGVELHLNGSVPEVPTREKIAWEKELTGVYFSPHPMAEIAGELADIVTGPCAGVGYDNTDREVVVAGMVGAVRQTYTRDGKPFVVAELEDTSGSIEVTVWPRVHETTRGLWNEGAVVIVKGQLRVRDGQMQLSCQQARRYVPDGKPRPSRPLIRKLTIRIAETGDVKADAERLSLVTSVLRRHPGKDQVGLVISTLAGESHDLEIPDMGVACGPELEKDLEGVLPDRSYEVA
jgi:DNA polymerase-3 subunit alpha